MRIVSICFLLFIFLSNIYYSIADTSSLDTFTIDLIEAYDPYFQSPIRSLQIQASWTCFKQVCGYQIIMLNSSPQYFKVLVDGHPCPSSNCQGNLTPNKFLNVTVYRPDMEIDLFDLKETSNGPEVYITGCLSNITAVKQCYVQYGEVTDGKDSYFDQICSCHMAIRQCTVATDHEMCLSGNPLWWNSYYGWSSTTLQTTTELDTNTTVESSTVPSTVPSTTVTTVTTTPSTKQTTTETMLNTTITSTPKMTTATTTITTTQQPTTTPSGIPPLGDLSNGGVDLNNVTQVLNDTLHYSKQGPDLNSTQFMQITTILHNSANLKGISSQNSQQILRNMDYCLNAEEKQIVESGDYRQRMLQILRPMVHNTIDKHINYLEGKNLGFTSKQVDCSNIQSSDGLLDAGQMFERINQTVYQRNHQLNSIVVPLEQICGTQQVTHLYFSIFRGHKLFTGKQQYRNFDKKGVDSDEYPDAGEPMKSDKMMNGDEQLYEPLLPPPNKCSPQVSVTSNTPVMSATLLNDGQEISRVYTNDVTTPAVMANLQFNINHIAKPLHGEFKVSWWDIGRQMWTTDHPCKIISIDNGIINANCEHLTDFAVIVDGSLNDAIVCDYALMTTGYVVNIMSIICLIFLSLLGLLVYWKSVSSAKIMFYLRGQVLTTGDVVSLAYYIVLLSFYILFVGFSDQSNSLGNGTSCIVIAAFMYFLLISSIMLNLLQGIRSIYKFFPRNFQVFFGIMVSPPAALSIGIIIPFILSLLLATFDTQFFERNDSFCWVRPDYITYAIVVPISILLFNAIVCLSFVTYKMFFAPKRKLSSNESKYHDAEFWSKIGGLVVMQFSLGLPWFIQYFTIQFPGTSFWHYLFTIILGSQGTILLLIFFYRRQKLITESRKSSERAKKMKNSLREANEDGKY